MSHNPWPFVVTALGAWSISASVMAQTSSRFDDPALAEGPRFAESTFFDQQGAPNRSGDAVDVRPRSTVAPPDELRSPFAADEPVETENGAVESEAWTDFARRGGQPRAPRLRTERTSPSADIVGVREIRSSSATHFLPINQPHNDVRVAQQVPDDRTRRNESPVGIRDRAAPANGGEVPATSLYDDIRKSYLEDNPPFSSRSSRTLPTSVEPENQLIRSLSQKAPGPDAVLKETGEKPGAAAGTPLQKAKNGLENGLADVMDAVTKPRSVPLWLTLGLFFSLPANLFFGWIAMSMHARYQDLLEEMQVSDTRIQRETRRRRRDYGEDEEPASRRSREADEESFLSGGIEV